jgi:glycosyltransferase involved in cell wall biosynthesis
MSGKKVIFWSHGLKGTDKRVNKIIRVFFFKYLPDALILYGDFSKNHMVKMGFDASKIFVIGNSLDYNLQKLSRLDLIKDKSECDNFKRSLFNNNDKTLIFIGRLTRKKNVDKLISSIQTLNNTGFNLNCIIIGDGESKDELKRLVDTNNLKGRVYFMNGIYDDTEIAKFFSISDLMVSPGNVGLNCIHSMAYGVPVLTHDNFSFQNPEVEAIINQENGLFYRYNDFNDMANKIKVWFELYDNETVFSKCIYQVENKFNPLTHSYKINEAVVTVLNNDS